MNDNESVMAKAKLTKEDWKEVRALIESGEMDYAEVSEKFGITKNACQQRAFREVWKTPRRLAEAALVEQAKAAAKTMTVAEAMETVTKTPESALTKSAARLAKLREDTPVFVAEELDKVIRAALTTGLPVPKSLKELSIATTIWSNMVGLKQGQGGPLVQIGVGMNWASGPKGSNEGPMVVVNGEVV
jgi:hypothetical protein